MKKITLPLVLGLFAVVAMAAAPAMRTVTFDPATGAGFVGKGDVQLVYGWNNAALQSKAAGVSFSYNTEDTYAATCTWVTGEGTRGEKTHNVNIPRHTAVNSVVNGTLRKNSQLDVTGFTLVDFGASTTDGIVPVEGGPCPGNAGNNGTWTAVSLASSSGGLFVSHNGGISYPLQ